MTCAFCEELLTRWKLLLIFERDQKAVAEAYWAIVEHQKSCEVCNDEGLPEVLNPIQPSEDWCD